MSRYHYDYIYTHRTRHSMRKVYLGLVSQSFGKRILINLNMYKEKLKFLRRETVLRQILKTNEKKQKN